MSTTDAYSRLTKILGCLGDEMERQWLQLDPPQHRRHE